MTNEIPVDSLPQQLVLTPLGEVLLAARSAKKLTQKDVSNNLRLSIKQIDALENNEFSALPDAMITRGFIRNYARLLGVDAEPLLASYRTRVPEASPNALSVQSSMYQVMSSKDSQPWLKYILGSILVLLFLLAWFFYMDYMPNPAKQSVKKAPDALVITTPSTAISLPEIALPAAERQADSSDVVAGSDASVTAANSSNVANVSADNITPTNTVPNAAVSDTATYNPTQSTESAKENTPVNSNSSRLPPAAAVDFNTLKANADRAATQAQVTQDGKATIRLDPTLKIETNDTASATKKVSMSFSEQTWVSVTNKSGKVIFEKIFAAGSTGGFDGEPPFNLVIGNAKATKLLFLGKQIDLASSTKSNVAHITLE